MYVVYFNCVFLLVVVLSDVLSVEFVDEENVILELRCFKWSSCVMILVEVEFKRIICNRIVVKIKNEVLLFVWFRIRC